MEAQRRSPCFTLININNNNNNGEGDEGVISDPESHAAQHDDHTPDQRRHDIFAEIITRAATAPDAPQLDGAPVADDVFTTAGHPGDPIGTMTESQVPVSRRNMPLQIDGSNGEIYVRLS